MINDIWTIFLNIVAAFIYAGLVLLWKKRANKNNLPKEQITKQKIPSSKEKIVERRAHNRQRLEAGMQTFLFYFLTFAVLYLSITLPPLFKVLFGKEEILLSNARFIGEFLPAIPIGKSYLQVTFFIAAATMFWPLLIISETIMSLIYPLIDAIYHVTQRIWGLITMIIFFFFCIPIAATSVWLFYEKSYSNSIVIVLFAILIALGIGQSQNEKR